MHSKEVFPSRIDISSPAGSRASDAPPSSDMSSYSTYYCVSPDVMEGYLDGAILKPIGGAVCVSACILLPIWIDLLEMVNVSSSLPFAYQTL